MAETGMPCPSCGATESGVIDTRHRTGYTRRRRECGVCAYRFSTEETIVHGRHNRARQDHEVVRTAPAQRLRRELEDAVDRLGVQP